MTRCTAITETGKRCKRSVNLFNPKSRFTNAGLMCGQHQNAGTRLKSGEQDWIYGGSLYSAKNARGISQTSSTQKLFSLFRTDKRRTYKAEFRSKDGQWFYRKKR